MGDKINTNSFTESVRSEIGLIKNKIEVRCLVQDESDNLIFTDHPLPVNDVVMQILDHLGLELKYIPEVTAAPGITIVAKKETHGGKR